MGIPISFKNRIVKDYEVEIVTPMFLGGEDGISAMLRTYPWKGLLRYWWRATSKIMDSKALYEAESEIFGNTKRKSTFSIHIAPGQKLNKQNEKFTVGTRIPMEIAQGERIIRFRLNILHYLAYGVFDKEVTGGRKVNREYLLPNQSFILRIIYSNEKIQREVERSLNALMQFGGLGSRAKNGFGNIFIKNLDFIKFDFNEYPNKLRDFPSFSTKTKIIYKTDQIFTSWNEALSEIGVRYREARITMEDGPKDSFKIRKNLAGPLIAGRRSYREDRLAKSVWLHVDKIDDGRYRGKILFMPYNWSSNPGEINDYLNAYNKLVENM